MSKWLNNHQSFGALVLRLALGAAMIFHGYQKVVPHGALDHFAHTVVTLGLPYWLGYVSAYTEFVGGILVLLGLLTRFASALIAVNMLMAFFTVGIHHNFDFYQYQLSLAAIAIMLLFYGAGSLSIDKKIGFA